MTAHGRPSLPDGVSVADLYRTMLLIRRFDERILQLRTDGRIDGVVHAAIGQEAVAAGVCIHLGSHDRLVSTHRGHGHCLAKGADPARMMAELFGRETGYCRGRGGSMHIADFDIGMLGANGIVGAGLPIALGAALAATFDGGDGIAVPFFGDGAAATGPMHESLNIAALWSLPVVFVCENNGWATNTPIEFALATPPAELARGYGIPTATVDGNDVIAVAEAFGAGAEQVRSGAGPFFLEATTFRTSAHATRARPHPDLRGADLIDTWRARDPLVRLLTSAESLGISLDREALALEVEDIVDEAVAFAERSPFPSPEAALNGVFA